MTVVALEGDLLLKIRGIEAKAYTNLVISNYAFAEQLYKQQYELLRAEEEKLSSGNKYHKGAPLHNWGLSLISQNKIAEGFKKIILAYIEDLLDSEKPEDAFNSPAYTFLNNYPSIDKKLLNSLFELACERRSKNNVPRDPEELLREILKEGYANLHASFTIQKTDGYPNIQPLIPEIKEENIPNINEMFKDIPKEKRVFVGGNHFNIVLLKRIKDVVEDIDDYKGILVSEITSNLNVHDKSIEILKACSYAIFEISIADGHLMEIERALDFERDGLKFLLLYQGFKTSNETTWTRMLEKFKDHMARYTNLTELTIRINEFLTK